MDDADSRYNTITLAHYADYEIGKHIIINI